MQQLARALTAFLMLSLLQSLRCLKETPDSCQWSPWLGDWECKCTWGWLSSPDGRLACHEPSKNLHRWPEVRRISSAMQYAACSSSPVTDRTREGNMRLHACTERWQDGSDHCAAFLANLPRLVTNISVVSSWNCFHRLALCKVTEMAVSQQLLADFCNTRSSSHEHPSCSFDHTPSAIAKICFANTSAVMGRPHEADGE